MPTERENLSALIPQDFNIAGNVLRAFFDTQDHLIFVLDNTVADGKTNTLLVINPVENRKWDDILSNDWGVDLETVRPKKDNKYQKLDIEYSGLAEYDNLIRDFKSGKNLDNDLIALRVLRDASIRRVAAERLAAANDAADKSRETIARANDTIQELQTRLKQLRSKLGQERNAIGREPTKQSAAKILRTESQIDAANEKLRRAKKRMSNAQRRLIIADEDATAARALLEREPVFESTANQEQQFTESVIKDQENIHSQPKVTEMANDEVKPLIDENPKILDDEIAFKPIDFDMTATSPTIPVSQVIEPEKHTENISNSFVSNEMDANSTPQMFEPLNFTPITDIPQISVPSEETTFSDSNIVTDADVAPSPVLDSIQPIERPVISDAPTPDVTPVIPMAPIAPVAAQRPTPPVSAAASMATAPVSTDSPTVGTNMPTQQKRRGPSITYYIMLILLITLSVLTLWLYQQKSTNTTPDLMAPANNSNIATDAQNDISDMPSDSPFIASDDLAPVTVEPVSTQTPVVATETIETTTEDRPDTLKRSETITEEISEPITVEPTADTIIVPEKIDTVPEPVVIESDTESVQTQVPSVEDEILANKPAYNVSQPDDMVVTNQEMDMDTPPFETPMCEDGSAPDNNGCCSGETFMMLDDGAAVCCPDGGEECFPPLK